MVTIEPTEEELLKGCISGSKEKWNLFVKKYSNLILHTIYKTLRVYGQPSDPDEVDDLFQEVFIAFYADNFKKLRIYDPAKGRTLASWIRLITVRMIINYIKKQKPTASIDDLPIEPSQAGKQELVVDEESQKCLADSLEELSEDDKLLIELSYVRELPPETVSQMLHISVGAFYTRKNRIITKLKKIVDERNIL
jgi:RNA polymerase sigma factor (sigma-70 family)